MGEVTEWSCKLGRGFRGAVYEIAEEIKSEEGQIRVFENSGFLVREFAFQGDRESIQFMCKCISALRVF